MLLRDCLGNMVSASSTKLSNPSGLTIYIPFDMKNFILKGKELPIGILCEMNGRGIKIVSLRAPIDGDSL